MLQLGDDVVGYFMRWKEKIYFLFVFPWENSLQMMSFFLKAKAGRVWFCQKDSLSILMPPPSNVLSHTN